MRNTYIVITLLLIAALAMAWVTLRKDRKSASLEVGQIKVDETIVLVEFARTPVEWSQGLSGRESLGEDQGMLFLSDQEVKRTFWMRGMRFPLDMLFIYRGKVVDMAHNVPAPSEGEDGTAIRVSTWLPAGWVLEVNGGWIEKHGVERGDTVEILETD